MYGTDDAVSGLAHLLRQSLMDTGFKSGRFIEHGVVVTENVC